MRDLLMRSLVGITLLAGYTAAQAQDYGRYRDDDRYYDRDDHGYRRGGGFFMDRVQSDLSYAESCAYSRGELKRIGNARRELREFQRAWNTGRIDHHELDDSIAAIQKVVDHNQLDERARSVLWSDLQRLRDFRSDLEHRYRW
jgi:hypothetical protein